MKLQQLKKDCERFCGDASNGPWVWLPPRDLLKLIAVAEAVKASIPEFGCTEELFEAMQALEVE